MATLKATSFDYGPEMQRIQAEKFRNRQDNHWRQRIALGHELVDRHALPRLGGKPPGETVVVDVGCSIGTFAIELAQRGFRTYGVDFDPSGLAIARELAREEGVAPEFVLGDVSAADIALPQIDIAVCFDIFEHLHDDELGSLLQGIRTKLSPRGTLVFHTFPTQYRYLFTWRLRWLLRPFAALPAGWLERVVRAEAALVDAGLVLATGQTYRDRIRREGHCNPTTRERLRDLLERAGYRILALETAQLYPRLQHELRGFRGKPVADQNLFGAAARP